MLSFSKAAESQTPSAALLHFNLIGFHLIGFHWGGNPPSQAGVLPELLRQFFRFL
jgi:hypothetical protein